MGRSKGAKKTGKERLDKYYHLAKDQGYRARSAFKLIQLAKKFDFLSKSRRCIDLCAAPGGWAQVAQRNMPANSQILAIDLVPIKPIPGVTCIQSDITSDKCRSLVRKELAGDKADAVLHDGAPNVGSSWAKDAYGQCELTLQACKIACEHLRIGGTFVTKVFRSADYTSLLWVLQQLFQKVDATKPQSSRNVSAEIFCICIGFKGGKIDPRFFDPKWVFMEVVTPEVGTTMSSSKGASASLSDYLKSAPKKHRGGYEPGDDLKIMPAHKFIACENPAAVLVTYHRISLTAEGSEAIDKHPLSNDDIRTLCADLKVLGKRDLSQLLKWRIRIVREQAKKEREAEKAEAARLAAENKAAAKGDEKPSNDVDDAIDEFLNEGKKAEKKEAGSDEESEVDEELEKDLAEHIARRRREEHLEKKKIMKRQKDKEWKKKLSLGGGKDQENQEQPELFKVNKRNMQALEDEDKYITPKLSDSEHDDDDRAPDVDSDSDSELDRLARMEVDLAVSHELGKMRAEDSNRTAQQRKRKAKKETRRQQTLKAWSGELTAFNEALDGQLASQRQHALENEISDDESELGADELKTLRALQDGTLGSGDVDAEALEALQDGGHPDAPATGGSKSSRAMPEESESDDDEPAGGIGPTRPKALTGGKGKANEGALVPVEDAEDDIETLRNKERTNRWFSQDIFKGVGTLAKAEKKEGRMRPLDRDSDASESGGEDGAMLREFEDEELPQLPLTDKEKRRIKRKREQEKLEKLGKKPRISEEDRKGLEVAPLEAPKPLVPLERKGPKKPDDPNELAETLALGSILVSSKKNRMELIDAAYNRWAFDRDETLPDWFTEEEDRHNKPELPITKELMKQFRDKLREINARPIRKVLEAKARKKRRLNKRLEKLRDTAMTLSTNDEMSSVAKTRQMRKEMRKMAKQEERKVTVVAMKKGGGGYKQTKGKAPKGAKTKVVDRRMKADQRGLKKALKRGGAAARRKHAKGQQKLHKSSNRKFKNIGGGTSGKKKKGGGGD
eukprot:TRINITY_DN24887_c0_g1_i1.p1 TRINITY_DN24887_c0_g1~~TRINITY_DN24887_c0_g1_i1.p1  ORF type:complete len:1019 (-),score=393.27 TRINITY_DN24887_c0_g1_i1:157-3213(-)